MTFLYLVLALLPSFLQRPLRNLLGARIERGARIGPFSLITVKDLRMARGAHIGPFVRMKADTAILGRNARIRSATMVKVRHFEMDRDALIDPMVLVNCDYRASSRLELGRAARIMSFSVVEPSEGISIGEQTGIGGQCLIFCHGSWPNYLDGAPYARGPVKIGERVWIAWRVMILPNADIGADAVIGAHTLVRGKVQPRALIAGVPGKMVKEEAWSLIEEDAAKERRLQEVVEDFHRTYRDQYRDLLAVRPLRSDSPPRAPAESVLYSFSPINRDEIAALTRDDGATIIDLARLYVRPGGAVGHRFVGHLATYGIRLSEADESEF